LERFPIGIIVLVIVSVIIYLGLAHRVLDRMRLSDRGALLVIGAIIIGSLVNIPLPFLPFTTSINIGGALIPVVLAVYLLIKAGTSKEWGRALLGAVATAAAVYFIGSVINRGIVEPAGRYAFIDAIYLYPLVGGIVAYLFGRSRRAAFVAATLGVLLVDIYHYAWLFNQGAPANYAVSIGGAGAFDTIVLAGIVAVLLAEIVGELFERLAGGPVAGGRPEELVQGLKKPEFTKKEPKTLEREENPFQNEQPNNKDRGKAAESDE